MVLPLQTQAVYWKHKNTSKSVHGRETEWSAKIYTLIKMCCYSWTRKKHRSEINNMMNLFLWYQINTKITYKSDQPCSPMISAAFMYSPADKYISAAIRGSLLLLAQSACLLISCRLSNGAPDPIKSWKTSSQ